MQRTTPSDQGEGVPKLHLSLNSIFAGNGLLSRRLLSTRAPAGRLQLGEKRLRLDPRGHSWAELRVIHVRPSRDNVTHTASSPQFRAWKTNGFCLKLFYTRHVTFQPIAPEVGMTPSDFAQNWVDWRDGKLRDFPSRDFPFHRANSWRGCWGSCVQQPVNHWTCAPDRNHG